MIPKLLAKLTGWMEVSLPGGRVYFREKKKRVGFWTLDAFEIFQWGCEVACWMYGQEHTEIWAGETHLGS